MKFFAFDAVLAVPRLWRSRGRADLSVRFRRTGAPLPARPHLVLSLSLGEIAARLAVPLEPVAMLARQREPGLVLEGEMTPRERALACEYLFRDVFDLIETASGRRAEIAEAQIQDGVTALGFEKGLEAFLSDGAFELGLRVALPATGTLPLTRFLWNLPEVPLKLAGSRLPLALRLAARRLDLADLRALRPGDGLSIPGPARPVLVLAERLVAPVRREARDGACFFAGPWREAEDSQERSYVEKGQFMDENEPPQPGSLGKIAVSLVVEAGRRLITLEEAERFAPGDRLPLGRPPEAGVDLVIGGRIIGTGRLVPLGEEVVVEIVELHP